MESTHDWSTQESWSLDTPLTGWLLIAQDHINNFRLHRFVSESPRGYTVWRLYQHWWAHPLASRQPGPLSTGVGKATEIKRNQNVSFAASPQPLYSGRCQRHPQQHRCCTSIVKHIIVCEAKMRTGYVILQFLQMCVSLPPEHKTERRPAPNDLVTRLGACGVNPELQDASQPRWINDVTIPPWQQVLRAWLPFIQIQIVKGGQFNFNVFILGHWKVFSSSQIGSADFHIFYPKVIQTNQKISKVGCVSFLFLQLNINIINHQNRQDAVKAMALGVEASANELAVYTSKWL